MKVKHLADAKQQAAEMAEAARKAVEDAKAQEKAVADQMKAALAEQRAHEAELMDQMKQKEAEEREKVKEVKGSGKGAVKALEKDMSEFQKMRTLREKERLAKRAEVIGGKGKLKSDVSTISSSPVKRAGEVILPECSPASKAARGDAA